MNSVVQQTFLGCLALMAYRLALRCSIALQQSRFAEAVEAAAGRIGGLGAEDEMIGELDVDGHGRLPQPARLCEVPDYGKWPGAPLVGLDRGRPGRQGQRFP